MFYTQISADLPSVERPGAAPGDDAFAQSHDRVSYGSAHLLELLHRAFDDAGVRDIAFLQLDDDVVYEDREATVDDEVDQLVERAAASGFLSRPFFRIVMALTHVEDAVHHAVEVQLSTSVPAGEPEMVVHISSRPEWAFPTANETAAAFAQRFRAQVGRGGAVATLARVQSLRERVLAGVRAAFADSTVMGRESVLRVVRPSLSELPTINDLRLGLGLPGWRFDLAPGGRAPAWADVFLNQFDDPSTVLRHVMLLECMMADGHLREEWVQVTEPSGKLLFDGTKARWFEEWPWRRKFELVMLGSGAVSVTLND